MPGSGNRRGKVEFNQDFRLFQNFLQRLQQRDIAMVGDGSVGSTACARVTDGERPYLRFCIDGGLYEAWLERSQLGAVGSGAFRKQA